MSDVDKVAEAIGMHEGWHRPDRSWECACGKAYGIKVNFDRHVAEAAIQALQLTQQWGAVNADGTVLDASVHREPIAHLVNDYTEAHGFDAADMRTRLVSPWVREQQ